MLLKSKDIKYLEQLPSKTFEDNDDYELEESSFYEEDYQYGSEEDITIGETILIGAYESRVIGEDDELTEYKEPSQDLEDLEYDEENGVYIGKTIVIGGSYALEELVEEEPEETVMDEFDSLMGDGQIPQIEEDAPHISDEEVMVDNFSNALSSLEKDLKEGIPDWKTVTKNIPSSQVSEELNTFLRDFKMEDRDASTFEEINFILNEEKQAILEETLSLISQAKDFSAISRVMAGLEGKIRRIMYDKGSTFKEDLLVEKAKIVREVENHVEIVISNQREIIERESEEHIENTVNFYKKKMEGDAQLLAAANNIISRREQILDEAYARSLKLIEEADEQANRIVDDAMSANQEAERIIEQAKYEAIKVEQRFRSDAENIISDANVESENIIQAAEEQHQQIVEAATQDGFNVGYQEGREEAIKENAQLLMDSTNALNDLNSVFPQVVQENEGRLIKLSIKVAEAIIQEEREAKPELVVKVLDKAIRRVSDLERVVIKVNPLDLDLVLPKQAYFKSIVSDVEEFIITGHYSVARGGCFIETNSGTVDAQFTTQLRIVQEIFDKIRAEYEAEEESEDEE